MGSHGYDNRLLSMRTIFVARGPRFARGRLVPAFRNVEVREGGGGVGRGWGGKGMGGGRCLGVF